MPTAAEVKAADPLRAYIVSLRSARRLSQPELAQAAGVKARTYIAWENGETSKLDVEVARTIVRVLGGLFEHLDVVLDMTADQARGVAENWINLSDEEREEAREGLSKLHRIVALSDDDPAQLDDVIRRLRDEARIDPDVLTLVSGYLAGLSSRSRVR